MKTISCPVVDSNSGRSAVCGICRQRGISVWTCARAHFTANILRGCRRWWHSIPASDSTEAVPPADIIAVAGDHTGPYTTDAGTEESGATTLAVGDSVDVHESSDVTRFRRNARLFPRKALSSGLATGPMHSHRQSTIGVLVVLPVQGAQGHERIRLIILVVNHRALDLAREQITRGVVLADDELPVIRRGRRRWGWRRGWGRRGWRRRRGRRRRGRRLRGQGRRLRYAVLARCAHIRVAIVAVCPLAAWGPAAADILAHTTDQGAAPAVRVGATDAVRKHRRR